MFCKVVALRDVTGEICKMVGVEVNFLKGTDKCYITNPETGEIEGGLYELDKENPLLVGMM